MKSRGFKDFEITWKSFEIFKGTGHEAGADLFKTAGINFRARKP